MIICFKCKILPLILRKLIYTQWKIFSGKVMNNVWMGFNA